MTNKNSFYFSSQLKILFNYLLEDGDELRVVGGAVRDFLAREPSSDFDIACKYLPQKTLSILQNNNIKTVFTGLKYGTVTAIIDDKQFQITTLREDIKNFGRSCEVEFVNDYYQDAKRRDFTINAMSIDFLGNLYDYFDGKQDLANKKIKFIGNADQRIKEDYLRILRFFRFSCFYGDKIDEDGFNACKKYQKRIADLSTERIRNEFFKILSCKKRDNLFGILSKMNEAKILSLILQGKVNLNRLENLFKLEVIMQLRFKPIMLIAALCFESKINLSKAEKKYISTVTNIHPAINFELSNKNLFGLLFDFNKQMIIDIFIIKLISSSNFLSLIDNFIRIYKFILNAKIPNLIVDGYDLIHAGIPQKNIGIALDLCKKYWIDNDLLVKKEQIIKYIIDNQKPSYPC